MDVQDLFNTIVGQAIEVERLKRELAAKHEIIAALVRERDEAHTPPGPTPVEGTDVTAVEGTTE